MSETSALEPVPRILYTTVEARKQGLTRGLERGIAHSYKPLITTADFYLIKYEQSYRGVHSEL